MTKYYTTTEIETVTSIVLEINDSSVGNTESESAEINNANSLTLLPSRTFILRLFGVTWKASDGLADLPGDEVDAVVVLFSGRVGMSGISTGQSNSARTRILFALIW